MISLVVPTLITFAAACSDNPIAAVSGEASLGCGFFEDPNNCWYRAVGEAYACAGAAADAGGPGKLGADGRSCAYGNGDSDAFDAPLTAADGGDDFGTTALRGGKSCYRFVHSSNGKQHIELTTASGTVKADYDDSSYSITCPDGKTLTASGVAYYASVSCNTPPAGAEVSANTSAGKALPTWTTPRTPHEQLDLYPRPAGSMAHPLSRCEP